MKCSYCGIGYRNKKHPHPVCAGYSVSLVRRDMAPATKWHSSAKRLYSRREGKRIDG